MRAEGQAHIDRIDAALVALFLAVVLSLLAFTVHACLAARRADRPIALELPLAEAA